MKRTVVAVFCALLLGIVALGNLAVEAPVSEAVAQTTPTPNDPVIAGAGDIANSGAGAEATAKLLDSINPTVVYTTGDNAYPNGTLSEFQTYYEPTWGRHKAKTKPSPGNHEHHTSGASGYYDYFGAAAGERGKGYYSYNLGEWHLIALNSSISMGATSEQVGWLKNDLAAHTNSCTLAYFHHPLFSSGDHGNQTQVKPLWDALYSANADIVLNGHDHSYERFAPQNPSGALDTARGIREFVVGTGGASYYPFDTIKPNSEARSTGTHGVLRLTLHAGSYDWQFIPEAGKTFTDSGSDDCHDASVTPPDAPDTTAPNTTITSGPPSLTRSTSAAFSFSSTEANSTFECKLDDGAFTPCSAPKGYTVTNGSHTFSVRARDRAGNVDATPASRTWRVDTIKPTVNGMSPRHTSTIRDTTPTIKATVKDNLTNLLKANIKLYVAGKLISPTKYSYSASTDLLTYNSPRLAKGKKTVKIVATDAARNVGTKSWYFRIK